MDGSGVVTVSERKSNSAGEEVHSLKPLEDMVRTEGRKLVP